MSVAAAGASTAVVPHAFMARPHAWAAGASAPTLVTGANGFIGAAVVRELLAAGRAVRAMVRPQSRLDNLDGLDVEIVQADLRDVEALHAAVHGCASVFHVAADYRLWARHPEEIYASNVEGTRNLVDAVLRADVGRLVYTSSVATLHTHADGTPADEECAAALAEMIGAYKRSKYLAEQVVRDCAARGALDVVIVHPSTPVGCGDRKPTPTGRVIVDAARGRMPAFVDTGLNVVHVDDVARGHVLAHDHGAPGRAYILGGQNLALRDILAAVAAFTGRHAPTLRLPHGVLFPAACATEAWARLSGHVPALTLDGLRMSRSLMYFSSARAERELGYRARPAKDALADAVEWFRRHGYC